MRILEARRLIDVLSEWGAHEGQGRLGRPATFFQGPNGFLNGIEIALLYRSPLVCRILAGAPVACVRVEIEPTDVNALLIADGRALEEWTSAILRDQTPSGAHVRAMAAAPQRVTGPLVCTARTVDGNRARVSPPMVIFDGWHRAAAWREQGRQGNLYPIIADLVITQNPVPLLGEA